MSVTAALKSKVEAWIKADPDPQDQEALANTLAQAEAGDETAQAELTQAFAGPLAFGTAGLRGPLGPGPGRMNRAVVIRTAAGLMAYLRGVIGQPDRHNDAAPTAQDDASPTAKDGTPLPTAKDGAQPRTAQPTTGQEPLPTDADLAAWSGAGRRRRAARGRTDHPTAVATALTSGFRQLNQTGALALLRRAKFRTAAPPKVVIGYDGRHGSAAFALDTAAVVVAAGGRALLWEVNCPTPLLAYAVRQLAADAGVMVTASHNPAGDNGYKVYLGGRVASGPARGAQIVPPADAEIAELIAQAPPANQIKRAARGWGNVGGDLEREYLRQAVEGVAPAPGAADLRIVHTAMHGVGGRIALEAFAQAGFGDVHSVAAQAQPDPDFPTAVFPNPEEPGAIDLATALAERIGADLVIAHDPDADRCAAAVFDPHGPRGGVWRMLTGDEVGSLLGEEAAKVWRDVPLAHDAVRPALASSVVSSRLAARIARDYLLRYERTLTGFKWIVRTPGLVFGYEEAIGYCVRPDMVRDKDGITAGLAIARLAAKGKLTGKTLIDLLDDLARRYGLYATAQVALRFDRSSELADAMRRLRRALPAAIGDVPVSRTIDLALGWEGLEPADALIFNLADGSRVVVRPSGTEPKIKCYLEVVVPVPATADLAAVTAVRRQAAAALDTLGAAVRSLLAGPPRP
ncbi:MAG: phospho-sugar mutase [Bifidobacteriaceae bacterium]|jgi:phosphomannomutase|nr:phospho-sugar mutase [Bifidobacteriaceae bacterium]